MVEAERFASKPTVLNLQLQFRKAMQKERFPFYLQPEQALHQRYAKLKPVRGHVDIKSILIGVIFKSFITEATKIANTANYCSISYAVITQKNFSFACVWGEVKPRSIPLLTASLNSFFSTHDTLPVIFGRMK